MRLREGENCGRSENLSRAINQPRIVLRGDDLRCVIINWDLRLTLERISSEIRRRFQWSHGHCHNFIRSMLIHLSTFDFSLFFLVYFVSFNFTVNCTNFALKLFCSSKSFFAISLRYTLHFAKLIFNLFQFLKTSRARKRKKCSRRRCATCNR